MSARKPETPRHDSDDEHNISDICAGRRFVRRDSEVWAIEQQLVAEGASLDNRAIPMEYHEMVDPEAIRDAIEEQSSAMYSNKNAIGYLNMRLREVVDG